MQQSLKFLSHCKQLNGSSPVWLHFKWSESTNLLKHFEQLNCPFFTSMSSFMFTLKRTDSKKVLCIGERGNGCCCSFKNVTQPLMFKCQTWLEKCQKSLDFTNEIIRFHFKIHKNFLNFFVYLFFRVFISWLNASKPYPAPIQLIREDSKARTIFVQHMIEDRLDGSFSYFEFLQHLKQQSK